MLDLRIRSARTDDAAFLVDCNCRMAMETEKLALDTRIVQEGVKAVLSDRSRGEYFLAVSGEQRIGQLMITFEWSDWRNANLWWVQSVYVLPEHRRQGAFAALYRHVRQLARQRGAGGLRLYVEENNRAAMETYRRLGLRDTHYRVMEEIFRQQ